MNLLEFDPMSMISNLGKYATLLEKKKTVIETSDHDCGNTHFFLGNGKIFGFNDVDEKSMLVKNFLNVGQDKKLNACWRNYQHIISSTSRRSWSCMSVDFFQQQTTFFVNIHFSLT